LAFGTLSIPELARIPQSHAVQMALVEAAARHRQAEIAIKFQLRFLDLEKLPGHFALHRPIQYLIGGLIDRIRKLIAGNYFFRLRRSV